MELQLRPFTAADEQQARAAHSELAADNFQFLLNLDPDEPWAAYVERLARYRQGRDLPERLVPASFLAADVDGEIVGRVSIRHRLNDWLTNWGGHIGYGVRPAFRRRGYATEILRQSLRLAADVGIERALITCADDNAGSAAVIEKCGGVLENVIADESGPGRTRRYWISLLVE